MLYNNIEKKSKPYLDIKVTAPGSAFCQLLIRLFVSDEKVCADEDESSDLSVPMKIR
jgi:hypothetical protein